MKIKRVVTIALTAATISFGAMATCDDVRTECNRSYSSDAAICDRSYAGQQAQDCHARAIQQAINCAQRARC